MSSVQHLREFIRERLAAAAEEIFSEVEKTIVSYEEELKVREINWKPEIKLNRIDLQNPYVSIEEDSSAIQSLCNQGRRSSHEEAEPQWSEDELMEPEHQWIKEEEDDPEPQRVEEQGVPEIHCIKKERPDLSLIDEKKEEHVSSVLKHEQQESEHIQKIQDQKDFSSISEEEQLIQQYSAVMETSSFKDGHFSLGETKTEQLSFHISPGVEGRDQEGSSSTVSKTQSHSATKRRGFTCEVCRRWCSNRYHLEKHYRIHTDLQQPHVSIEEDASAIQQLCNQGWRSGHEEAEPQWSENNLIEEQNKEPEGLWIEEVEEDPEPQLLNSSLLKHEQLEPEHLAKTKDQKDFCSSQEGEQLVQQQYISWKETSALQGGDLNEGQTDISPDQGGSSSTISKSRSHSVTQRKWFTCEVCGRCCRSKHTLERHYRTHPGEKPFSCLICRKGFSMFYNLKVHQRSHTGEKPFLCPVCGRGFAQISNLKVHQRIHTGEKPFSCQQCRKSFSQKCHLQAHIKTHTGEYSVLCETCGKPFKTSGELNVHMRTHTGEKPFSCPICGKGFSQLSNLNVHQRTHTGKKFT